MYPPDAAAENRCEFYLPNKLRYCANSPLRNSKFCGNHDPSSKSRRIQCPLDPSHSVFVENLDSHIKRCPLKKQVETLESKPYYSKGINGVLGGVNVASEEKRRAIYEMSVGEFDELVRKIRAVYSAMEVELKESFMEPDACKKWINQKVDRQIPYQEKHVMQQASIIGNMEAFGILNKPKESLVSTICEEGMEHDSCQGDEIKDLAVVEFGAGRGYLTHMLVDCYEMKKIFLVERRSYKLKPHPPRRRNPSRLPFSATTSLADHPNTPAFFNSVAHLPSSKTLTDLPTTQPALLCNSQTHPSTPSASNLSLKNLIPFKSFPSIPSRIHQNPNKNHRTNFFFSAE